MKEMSATELMRSGGRWTAAYEKTKSALFSTQIFKLIIRLVIIFAVLSIPYWLFIASDRYVSQATVIVQRTDQIDGPAVTLPVGMGAGPNAADQLLLREYLLSEDMLDKLDAKFDLRSHYSDWHRDPFSRMWFKNAPHEVFYQYWLNHVDIEYDDYAGVLRIQVQAYDAKTAKAIADTLVQFGEAHMNQLGHQLAQSQVDFLSKQVGFAQDSILQASQNLIDFQNKKGLVSPAATADSLNAIISKLEGQKADLQTQLASLPSNMNSDQPVIVMLRKSLTAVQQLIEQKRAELASPKSQTLNYTVAEYKRLEMQQQLAEDLYKTALTAVEQGRMDAARKLKMVSILQEPTTPGYPTQPQRIYNAFAAVLIALCLIGVFKLLESIILDHVD